MTPNSVMHSARTLSALAALALLACQRPAGPEPQAQPRPTSPERAAEPDAAPSAPTPAYDGPPKTVLVELFSSQGCNSCPAADALVGRFAELGLDRSRAVPLTFHVTYWDDLGWADPFASPVFDQRQIAYAQAVPQARADDETTIRGPYTPQMVVDGRVHFSGSLQPIAVAQIEQAERRPTAITLEPHVEWSDDFARVTLDSRATPDAGLDTDRTKVGLFAALVQHRVETEVPRGENAGETLTEHEVVRAFEGPKLFRSGRDVNHTQFELPIPDALAPSDAGIVVFAQSLATLEILAVATAESSS